MKRYLEPMETKGETDPAKFDMQIANHPCRIFPFVTKGIPGSNFFS